MTTNFRQNFLDLMVAKLHGDRRAIHETSLTRIMTHTQNAPQKGFAILTSWRAGLSREENVRRFIQLKSKLRGLGLGFSALVGHWQENPDPSVSYDQTPKEQLVDTTEPSLFVSGITLEDAKEIGASYDQDAVVYAGPETQGKVNLVFRDGGTQALGALSPMTLGQAYSELRQSKQRTKKSFKFEYVEWPTQGHTEALLEQSFRNKVPF